LSLKDKEIFTRNSK